MTIKCTRGDLADKSVGPFCCCKIRFGLNKVLFRIRNDDEIHLSISGREVGGSFLLL